MLVSFHESYLLLVQMCALFCGLTMVYSLFEYLTRGIRQKRQMKKNRDFKRDFNRICRLSGRKTEKIPPESAAYFEASKRTAGFDDCFK